MPTVRIQLVVYGNEFGSIRRTITALRACVRHAVGSGRIEGATIAIGDCSPTPQFDDLRVAELASLVADDDVAVSYRFFDANLGSGGGSNRLAEDGDEPLIWVLNPDTYASPTCLSLLVDGIDAPGVAAADARQLPIEHPKAYDPHTGEAPWISGACMLVHRAAFDAVGGFDSHHFPLYCDDVDISWRWRAGGHRVRTVPRATVFHDKRPGPDGRPFGSPVELESGALSRLKLARRYGRPDVEHRELAAFEASGAESLLRVACRFRELDAAHDLPTPLPAGFGVADLDQKYYGPHRFRFDL